MSSLVSVIVPTRNSARTLEACLRSIRAQTHQRLELVVVDNYSEDGTATIARRLSDSFLSAGPERSTQRNVGAARAAGSQVLFVDSDMLLEPEVVAQCLDQAEAGASAVVIPEESFGEGFWARCKALERSCYQGDSTIEAARFFDAELFERIGGYDEQLSAAEDWDLHERARLAGSTFGKTAAMIRHDEGHLRLQPLLKKKFRYGIAMSPYLRKHPELARSQLRLFRPAFRAHADRLRAQPLTTLGMFAMKSSEGAAGVAGIALGKARERRLRADTATSP
jgi:glycosyltransferase involved in cell wall biosynthesis